MAQSLEEGGSREGRQLEAAVLYQGQRSHEERRSGPLSRLAYRTLTLSPNQSSSQKGTNSRMAEDSLEEEYLAEVNPEEEPLVGVNPEEEPLVEVYEGGGCLVEECLEEGLLEGELLEGELEEELQEEQCLEEELREEGDPSEEALGPMGLEGRPREVLGDLVDQVGQVDPSLPELHVLHASDATLHLPSSLQGPSEEEEDHHRGKADPSRADPILGDPLGPSLEGAHVVPTTQAVAGPEVPSLQEEDANRLDGPSLEEGGPSLGVADASLDEDLWGPWVDVLDLDTLLRWA